MDIKTALEIGSLLLWVGGPTTIATGLALRIGARVASVIVRRLLIASVAGAVASGSAYLYMQGKGGGDGEAGVLAAAGFSQQDLNLETIEIDFREADGDRTAFFRNDVMIDNDQLYLAIYKLRRDGKLERIVLIDHSGRGGENIVRLENVANNVNVTLDYMGPND